MFAVKEMSFFELLLSPDFSSFSSFSALKSKFNLLCLLNQIKWHLINGQKVVCVCVC